MKLIVSTFLVYKVKKCLLKSGKVNDLDVENIAHGMGIDNHLQFSEDEAGTKAMFARENRARERYNKCRAMDCKMEAGSYFEEK